MRLRNASFALICCLFFCGPMGLFCLDRAGVEIPYELSTEPVRYLSGGLPDADVQSVANLSGFLDRSFQGAIEIKVGRYIPFKADAVISNAILQRECIRVSNTLFEFDAFPTYFASTRVAYPGQEAVSYLPLKSSAERRDSWRSFAEGLRSVAERFPDKRFVVYVVQGYQEPSYNPAYELTSNPAMPEECVALFNEVLADAPNVTVLSRKYDSGEDYYCDFFRTDHHWNIKGAFGAYRQIVAELGLEAIEAGQEVVIPDYRFTGATARWGLDMLSQEVFDFDNDYSNLTVQRTDGLVTSGNDHQAFFDASAQRKPYTFYDSYYDNFGDCKISGGHGSRNALLVSNSYKGAIQRPLACSYASLTVNSQLHPASRVTNTLAEQIVSADADDIILVANPSNFWVESKYWF